jgi:hypothetical protein
MCPMSNSISIEVLGSTFVANARTFSSGSNGYGANGKVAAPCAPTKGDFLATAKPLVVKVGNTLFAAQPRCFSTGSVGYMVTAKLPIDGQLVQVGINLTHIHSKTQSASEQLSGVLQVGANLTVIGSKNVNKA